MLKVSSRSRIVLSDEESEDNLDKSEARTQTSYKAQLLDAQAKSPPMKEMAIENSPVNARNVKKGGRLNKGKKVVAKKAEVVLLDEEEDDEEEGDDDADVLIKCESLSTKLLDSLKKWIAPGSSDGNGSAGGAQSLDHCDSIKITTIDSEKVASDEGMITMELMNSISKIPLKSYQMVGVNWLKLLNSEDINGVLADDMGLGKTAQIITFLAWLKHSRDGENENDEMEEGESPRTHLIVVPASTLSNWEAEMRRFCPQLEVFVYHGDQSERFEQRYRVKQLMLNRKCDVVLTTYSYFSGTQRDERVFFKHRHFDYLVVDEAHALKSTTTARFSNLAAVHARHKILISGTPVQNNLSELVALLTFLMPHLFRRAVVEDLLLQYKDIEVSRKAGVKRKKKEGESKGEHGETTAAETEESADTRMGRLRNMLAPFVLRRLKCDVLEQLVGKEIKLVKVNMSTFQNSVYQGILESYALRKKNRAKENKQSRVHDELLESLDRRPSKKAKGKGKDGQFDPVGLTSPAKKPSYPQLQLISSSSKPQPPPVQNEEEYVDLCDTESESEPKQGEGQDSEIKRALVDICNQGGTADVFHSLRKAANHPLLLRVKYRDEAKMDQMARAAASFNHFGDDVPLERVRKELDSYSDFDLHHLCCQYDVLKQYRLPDDALYSSSKLQRLQEMLPRMVKEGHHILVFSQWVRILDLLEVLVGNLGLSYLRLDGSTQVADRKELIDAYNEGNVNVFLLSTRAGGLGINLTRADTVILHDLDFNPESDKQAIDRAHRIGQTRLVTVYKFCCGDTVDEQIFNMGHQKSKITDAVLHGGSLGLDQEGEGEEDVYEDANSSGYAPQMSVEELLAQCFK